MKNLSKRKWLHADEIDQVCPKFQKLVQSAFERGEKVPYSVTLLTDDLITSKDKAWGFGKIAAYYWSISR